MDDFCADSVARKLTYSIDHRRLAKNSCPKAKTAAKTREGSADLRGAKQVKCPWARTGMLQTGFGDSLEKLMDQFNANTSSKSGSNGHCNGPQ